MTLVSLARGVLAHWAFAAPMLSLLACAAPEAKQPNPMRAIDERRAIPIMAQAFKDESETPSEGREIRLATGKALRIDVAAAGHKYGVAYVTASDLATLDAKSGIRPHTPTGDLPIVQGTGPDADAVVLILFADDYQYDDLAGEQHESTTITAEKKLARDVRDFIVQARSKNLPLMQPDAEVAKKFLAYGATALPVGVAAAAIGYATLGSVVSLAALAALIAGLHTFGRAGPDPGA